MIAPPAKPPVPPASSYRQTDHEPELAASGAEPPLAAPRPYSSSDGPQDARSFDRAAGACAAAWNGPVLDMYCTGLREAGLALMGFSCAVQLSAIAVIISLLAYRMRGSSFPRPHPIMQH
jgi:hypothetical protein